MKRVVTLIGEARVFHIATIDGKHPRVRPFGFIMDFEDKIYFCTGNQKPFFKQIQANPNVEVSAMLEGGKWVRLNGEAVADGNMAAKKKAFEILPDLAGIYKGPDDPTFEVFYLEKPEATLYSFTDAPEKLL